MGNALSSSQENDEEIGDQIFQVVQKSLEITDNEKLEKITGIILDSGLSKEALQNLIKNDIKELERRIEETAKFVETKNHTGKGNSLAANGNTDSSICSRLNSEEKNQRICSGKRKELITHFERMYPTLDSAKIADELLGLTDYELENVVSSPAELKCFIKNCFQESIDDINKEGATAKTLDSFETTEKIKKTELLSEKDVSDEDIESLIGNLLFERVHKLHPSKAELLTGVLMDLEKDMLLHLLTSAPLLHENIAKVIDQMKKKSKLKERDIVIMHEELGDLIFALLEKNMNADTASQVTGMLLEMDMVCLHDILADEEIFQRKVKDALKVLGKRPLINV